MPSTIKNNKKKGLPDARLPDGQGRQGFTLIELLVVIAIIGILATVGLNSFKSSLIKGRDAQRKHDLGQIQKALEMYLNDHGKYRTLTEGLPAAGTEWNDNPSETIYMKSVPGDPKGGNYCYESDATGSYYRIYAKLENIMDSKKITPASTVCTLANGYIYGVSSSNAKP
jgi:general secretion pathway protein G